ncbi:MAG: hypothetical protein SFT94_02435, partial [Pseudanabaenaceae cyanobacterium bins.68]|nr:hypothetical protein [Pseudanabaenaceae cyanobacterium bins.68]
PRAHSQTPQNLLDQKRQSATQPNYLLIQPQYPRPAMAPAVFYLLPLHPVDAPNPVLKSPYTHQLPYQFPNQVQSLPPQYFIPSPGIPGLNPIQPPTPRSNP